MVVPEQCYNQVRFVIPRLLNNYIKYSKYMTKNSEFIFCCVTKVYFGCEPLLDSFQGSYVDLYCFHSLRPFYVRRVDAGKTYPHFMQLFLRALNISAQCLQF
jgi:hypothetical protein